MDTKLEKKVPEQDSETKEKKQEENQQPAEFPEMKDVEILEFGLSEEEINELIEKLNHLKKIKTEISFTVDDENEFLIKYLSEGILDTKTDLSNMGMRG